MRLKNISHLSYLKKSLFYLIKITLQNDMCQKKYKTSNPISEQDSINIKLRMRGHLIIKI